MKATANSIGYFELSFAQDAKPQDGQVDNGGGAVEATAENAAKTIAAPRSRAPATTWPLTIDYTTKDRRLPDRPGDLRDHLREGHRGRQLDRSPSPS